MNDRRRRAASLLVLIAAGLASAGTTPMPATPAPARSLTVTGAATLSGADPAAVRIVELRASAVDPQGISFQPTVTAGTPEDGYVSISVVNADGKSTRNRSPIGPVEVTPVPATVFDQGDWRLGCEASADCERQFAVVMMWIGAPKGGSASIDWSMTAKVTFGSPPAATGTVELVGLDDGPKPATTTATATAGPVHLTETDRVRYWRVKLALADGSELDTPWPVVLHARLRPDVAQVDGPAAGEGLKDPRASGRALPVRLSILSVPGTDERTTFSGWAEDGPIAFEPVMSCHTGTVCEVTKTIGLVWADGRPEATFDASWTLDVAVVASDGTAIPVKVSVEPIELPPTAVATTSGTLVLSDRLQSVSFTAVGDKIPNDDPWRRVFLPSPTRAVIHARVTSTGTVPLPVGAMINISTATETTGPQAFGQAAPGREISLAFQPTDGCSSGEATCAAGGTFTASIGIPNPNQIQAGMAATIEWTLEVEVGTIPDGAIRLEVKAQPTPPPSGGAP
jgi:hypothetical protein